MSTRRAPKDAPMRQERFASSSMLRKGLLGNLVAKRCETVRLAEDRELIWWLQEISLRAGSGPHFACTSFPSWNTPDHQGKPGETAFERLARELCARFPLYIIGNALKAERELPNTLAGLCIDPRSDIGDIKSGRFNNLATALLEYKREMERASLHALACTSVADAVWEGLDYCHSQKGIVLLEGIYRSGKSYSAQAWCLSRPGRARYVQLSAYTDETSFFRLIARSLGTASSAQRKSIEIRQRVEDALRGRDIMLVIDEAEHLMPSLSRPTCAPDRLNYLIKDLDNRGIAVALLAGLNFERTLSHIARKLPTYGTEQFYGRLSLRKQLPDNLTQRDLFAIANLAIPEADEETRMLLVGHALTADGRIGAFEHTTKRACYFAQRAGRKISFDDAEAAIAEASGPSVSATPAAPARGPRGLPARDLPTSALSQDRRHPSSIIPLVGEPGGLPDTHTAGTV